ncbi:MAG: tautomerase family protein [Oceanospirillaceae bacterium]|nr:tautomerase family protein [Oceanospirillaceae bacterium]
MAQVKIYGLKSNLARNKVMISDGIHKAIVQALAYPVEKKFQRFISLAPDEFYYPSDRSEEYIIIEISMFEGRSKQAKKALIMSLYAEVFSASGICAQNIEITIFETPKENWGIRGVPANELELGYQVNL